MHVHEIFVGDVSVVDLEEADDVVLVAVDDDWDFPHQ